MKLSPQYSPKGRSNYKYILPTLQEDTNRSLTKLINLSELETPQNPYKSFKSFSQVSLTAEKIYQNKQIDKMYNYLTKSYPKDYIHKLSLLLKNKDKLFYKLIEGLKESPNSLKKFDKDFYITILKLDNYPSIADNRVSRMIEINKGLNIAKINISKSDEEDNHSKDLMKKNIPEFQDGELSYRSDNSDVNISMEQLNSTVSINDFTNDVDKHKELIKLLNTKEVFKNASKFNVKKTPKYKSVIFRSRKKQEKEQYLNMLPVKYHMKKLDEKMKIIENNSRNNECIYKMYTYGIKTKKDVSSEMNNITKRLQFYESRRNEYLDKMLNNNCYNKVDNASNYPKSQKSESSIRKLKTKEMNSSNKEGISKSPITLLPKINVVNNQRESTIL